MARATDNLTITDRELLYRLGWFTHIRWAMGAMSLLMLVFTWHVMGVRFRAPDGQATLFPAVNVSLLIFLYNAAFTFLLYLVRKRGISRGAIQSIALGQIVCDMIAVCALVHFSGGIENFFVILILLPLVIATELLPQGLAYAVAAGAAALVHALAWGEQQGVIQHVRVEWPGEESVTRGLPLSALYVLEVTTALTGMIFAVVFIASAISRKLRDREQELEEAYHQLHLADETKSFFMRKAGHDLRAPLSAISSILTAVSDGPEPLTDRNRDLIARARRRAGALMSLVEDLHRFSSLRSTGNVMKVEAVPLDQIVTNTADLFTQKAKDAGITLACEAAPLTVQGDDQLLRELVTNLVANAIQYTPAGGRVDVDLRKQDGLAVLRVADTGIGLSEAARQNLFSEFYRAPEAKQVFPNGTGLGLTICRQIVRMHQGDIEALGREEGGTVFEVRIPLSKPDPET